MPEPVEGSGPGPRPVDVISLITMLLTISVTKEQVRNGESRTFVLTPGDDLRLELLPGVRAPHPD
ncbi:hypothetical protein [Nonomuraea sp. NPDC049504]|uniref:hypothetical protein n=1 Tax=Nonomuraea sp. NPDC049504 TaxID=3154729 RepID=UPI003428921C